MTRNNRHLPRLLALGLLLAAPAFAAHAATLRSMTTLHSAVVRLSDLFDGVGRETDRVLGSAPGPGGRIVVEAPQLAAIARQFGVEWRPASPADRAVLERPGRMLPRDEVLKAVKAALITAGASPDCELTLPGFTPPLVPVESTPQPLATDLDYDSTSGRFTAVLSITGAGMEPINLRVAGEADETIELPVAVARLTMGTVLRAGDMRTARVHTAMLHSEVLHGSADLIGMQLRHPVAAGQPFGVTDVMRPSMVQRGANVEMRLAAPGLSLIAQGVAMEAGATGDRIRVLNPSSHTIVQAEVTGPGNVRVMPDSLPVSTASRTTQVWVQ